MTKVRTRLKKLTREKALGPELTALTKKVEAVDAACCLTPERIPHLSVPEMRHFVQKFEGDGWDLPVGNQRLISCLVITDAVMKGQLSVAMDFARLWPQREDPLEWSTSTPLMSALPFQTDEEDNSTFLGDAMKCFLNMGLSNTMARGQTDVAIEWSQMYLTQLAKAHRCVANCSDQVKQAIEQVASAARGLLALAVPEPFPHDASPADVEFIVPKTRDKKRKQEHYVATFKDTILQNDAWSRLLDAYRAVADKEAIHGKDVRQCAQDLKSEDEEARKRAMEKAFAHLADWRSMLREGATESLEAGMLLEIEKLFNTSKDVAPPKRVATLRKLRLVMSCFEGTVAFKLTQGIEEALDAAAADERSGALTSAIAELDGLKMERAIKALKGSKLEQDTLHKILDATSELQKRMVESVLAAAGSDAAAIAAAVKANVDCLQTAHQVLFNDMQAVVPCSSAQLEARLLGVGTLISRGLALRIACSTLEALPTDAKDTPWKGEGWQRMLAVLESRAALTDAQAKFGDVDLGSEAATNLRAQALGAFSGAQSQASAVVVKVGNKVITGLEQELDSCLTTLKKVCGGNGATGTSWTSSLAADASLDKALDAAERVLLKSHAGNLKGAEQALRTALANAQSACRLLGKMPDYQAAEDVLAQTAITKYEVKLVKTMLKYPQVAKQRPLFQNIKVEMDQGGFDHKQYGCKSLWTEYNRVLASA